jgi:hypothetical protein
MYFDVDISASARIGIYKGSFSSDGSLAKARGRLEDKK